MQKAGITDEAAEDGIGHAGHGRKNGRGRDAHAADLDRLRYRRGLSGAAGNRSVPVLAHGIILCVSATSEGQNQDPSTRVSRPGKSGAGALSLRMTAQEKFAQVQSACAEITSSLS